uniref:Interferon omega-1 n=1 Tax=Anthurium amnicola TaxID=1678845 RepID=A0A1D1Z899_9ARAE
MEDHRSRSYGDGRLQMEVYGGRAAPPYPYGLHDLRSYSVSHPSYSQYAWEPREVKIKKVKSFSGSSSSKGGWGFKDPELQRKKRIAGYKLYSVEGKLKGSLRRSFRWLKDRYTQALYSWG